MARTRIEDLAHDVDELGAAEQKEVKGGAVPVVNTAVVGAATAGAGTMIAAGGVLAATHRKASNVTGAAQEGAMASGQTNPLYQSAVVAKDGLFNKPE
jgi:hypothetical protein